MTKLIQSILKSFKQRYITYTGDREPITYKLLPFVNADFDDITSSTTHAVTSAGQFPIESTRPSTPEDIKNYKRAIKNYSFHCHHKNHRDCTKKSCRCYCHKLCDTCGTTKSIHRFKKINYCYKCWSQRNLGEM